ncbi:hypothetical protein PG994_004886 [Apiospora phragmitis]|uniref:DUF676 domain-containing protein n=1 Tax=Apiospora phragmitis TaxID=2905665 RepID=A0ABR1VT33_9PEZI
MPTESPIPAVVQDTGFTVLHEPAGVDPIVDQPRHTSPNAESHRRKRDRWSLKGAIADTIRGKRSVSSPETLTGVQTGSKAVYWPRDLLPVDCPTARIQVWGYDSVVTKGYTAANKSNLFSHAKSLLYALERQRRAGRPIVFVAHSLGGLLVKEVLHRSQYSEERGLRDIVESTKAVVFMGTPHRGSSEFAKIGELTRKIAAGLMRVDSNSTIIRVLGIDSPELELSR